MDGLVGAHGEGLADRVGGLVRAHREDRHLAAVRLLDRQRLFDGVLVELVDDTVGGFAIEGVVVAPQLAFGRRVRHLFHADDDVHSVYALPDTLRNAPWTGAGSRVGTTRVPNPRNTFGFGGVTQVYAPMLPVGRQAAKPEMGHR